MRKTETKQRIDALHDTNVDVVENHIYVVGSPEYHIHDDGDPGVEHIMSTRFIKNLHLLYSLNPSKPITIHLKLEGGSWQEGMAVYDLIKLYPNPITIINYTQASSMSSVILQSSDKRYMLKNSIFMFHMGNINITGEHNVAKHTFEFMDRVTVDPMLQIYIDSMKTSKRFKHTSREDCKKILLEIMSRKGDVYLTATEAVEWGFATKIVKSWKDIYPTRKVS